MANLEIQINKIEGYEDILPRYWINKEGQITNKETGKTIKWLISRHGYYYCHLWANNGNRYIRMHRLLALAFIPNPNNYPLVRHLNDIKTDNRLENLEWVSHRENCIRVKDRNYKYRKKNGYYQVKDDQYDPEIKHIRYFKKISDITDNKTDQNTIQKCLQYNRYSVKFRSMFYFYENIPDKYKEMYIKQVRNCNENENWQHLS